MKSLFLLFLTLTARLQAQPPDLDGLSREVDLSTLKPSLPVSEPGEGPSPHPRAHLFKNVDRLRLLAEPAEDPFHPLPESDLLMLRLPAADYLVAPNPSRIDTAYQRLLETLDTIGNPAKFPLKVVLHADSKFSVAIALARTPNDPLPPGVDISPLPAMTLYGVFADIQVLQKDRPSVLAAFQSIRRHARSAGLQLDSSELYAFPREPGRVFFAMRVQSEPARD